jgi:MYXO-CTERM domain-containing protein
MHKNIWVAVILCAAALPTTAFAEGLDLDNPDPSYEDGPPRGAYVWLTDEQMDQVPEVPEIQFGGNHILYLNRCRGGLTITHSNQNDSTNNQSTVGGGTFPEYPFGDASWNEVVSQTRTLFEPYGITVTDEDPSPAPHDEAIVCGTPGVIGLPNGVGGVAPFSCGQIPNAITFTFAAVYGGDEQQIVATVGQEAAHAWGLEHLLSCNDPMTYLNSPWSDEGSCWPKSFQDKDTQCGEYNPRACDCGGSTQNSHQHILNMFGAGVPDTAAPTAAITSPTDGETFPTGASFPINVEVSDDIQVVSVELFSNGAPAGPADTSSPFGPFPAENTPANTYELYIVATDAAGNSTTSETVTVYVNDAGEPPAGSGGSDSDSGGDTNGGGSDSDGDSAGSGGSDGNDSGGGVDDDDGGAFPGESGGSGLPPGYGLTNDGAEGCACSTGSGDDRWGLLFLTAMFGWGLRARRRR